MDGVPVVAPPPELNEVILAFYTPNYHESGSLAAFVLNQFVGWYTSTPPALIHPVNKRTFSHVELVFKRRESYESEAVMHSFVIQSPKAKPSSIVTRVWEFIKTFILCFFSICWYTCSSVDVAETDIEVLISDHNGTTTNDQPIIIDPEKLAAKIEVNKPYNTKNTNYGFVGISLRDRSTYDAMYMDVINLCSLEESFRFNYFGQLVNFLPKPLERALRCIFRLNIPHREVTRDGAVAGGFCSEIICGVLKQHVGIVKDLDPSRTSPNDLWYGLILEAYPKQPDSTSISKCNSVYYINDTPLSRLKQHQKRQL